MLPRNRFTQWLSLAAGCAVLILWMAACSTLDEIGKRPNPTDTLQAARTATLGGRISVWLVSPTGFPIMAGSTNVAGGQGEVIGPVGTATALSATLYAATQIAAEPPDLPNFRTADCPAPSGRVPEPPPDSFTEYAAAIGTYLSDGGPTSVLESELRQWAAITDKGGVVQADTDLTGDDVPEIIVNLFNPLLYNGEAILNAGQVIVYGCDNGKYRVLYQSPSSPGLALPVLHRVGDMNGDVKAELVYDVQSCSQSACTREGYILTWNPITGTFDPLNNEPIIAVNGRLGVLDIDSDGILELTASSNPPSDVASGPRRSVVDIWDWTGKNYVLAQRIQDDARFRIHVQHDADDAFRRQDWSTALAGYRRVRDETELLAWTIPGEPSLLRAFASYRMVITYARLRDGRAETILSSLLAEYPEGTSGAAYAAMAQAFMDNYRATTSTNSACQAALGIAATRPETISLLNSYGYANPSYTLSDLCPF